MVQQTVIGELNKVRKENKEMNRMNRVLAGYSNKCKLMFVHFVLLPFLLIFFYFLAPSNFLLRESMLQLSFSISCSSLHSHFPRGQSPIDEKMLHEKSADFWEYGFRKELKEYSILKIISSYVWSHRLCLTVIQHARFLKLINFW